VPALPGLTISLWLQFFIDNFATVAEAVEYMEKHPFQVRPLTAGIKEKKLMKAHL
jgi:choloylglycine hydrolase